MLNKITISQNTTGSETVSNECIPKLYKLTKDSYITGRLKGYIRPLYSFPHQTDFLTRRYELRIENINGTYYEWDDPEFTENIGKSNYFGDTIGVVDVNQRIDISGSFVSSQCPLLGNKNIEVIDLRPFTNIYAMKHGLCPITVIPSGLSVTELEQYNLREIYVRQPKGNKGNWHPTFSAAINIDGSTPYTLEKCWFENSGETYNHPFDGNGIGTGDDRVIKHFYFKNNYIKPGFDVANILSVGTTDGFPYATSWQSNRSLGTIKNMLVDSKIPLMPGGVDGWQEWSWQGMTFWVPDWQFETYTQMAARVLSPKQIRRISEYWTICSDDGIDPSWWRDPDTVTYMDGDIDESNL